MEKKYREVNNIDEATIEARHLKERNNDPFYLEEITVSSTEPVTEEEVVKKFTDQILNNNVDLDFIDIVNENFWHLLSDPTQLHKAPIETPEVEQSQVGEEEIDKATTEYIESISDKDNRYINIQVNHVWAAAIKWYQSNYPTHPTPKKVPTVDEIENAAQDYKNSTMSAYGDAARSHYAYVDFKSGFWYAIHSLLPDHNILQREGVKLLEWALSICNEIQSKKTYGNRFPETASLGSAIEEYLSDQSKPTKD